MHPEQGSLFLATEKEGTLQGDVTITGSRDLHRDVTRPLFDEHLHPLVNKDLTWLLGGARGVDAWALEWLLDAGEICWVVVPFTAADQPKSVQHLLPQAARLIELKLPKSKGAYHQRNHYIVDRSRVVIGFWSGKPGGTLATLEYALHAGKEVHAYRVYCHE